MKLQAFIKYFFVGGAAGMIDLIVFLSLVKLELHWFIAATISFLFATLVNYVLSIKHVFTSGIRFRKDHEILLIFFVSLVGLLINWVVLGLLISSNLIPIWLSKIGATGSVFIWNFFVRYHFVFKDKK